MNTARPRTPTIGSGIKPAPPQEIKFVGALGRAAFDAWRANREQRDACPQHSFVRVQREPPKWWCPNCQTWALSDYIRPFERGLIAAGADPQKCIADYGEWP